MTETTHVTVRLKPLRIAYVFPPNDRRSFLAAAEISTCLWGGVRYPMIPQYSRVPQHMRPPFGDPPSAEEVVANFVATFEPDIIVAKDPSKLAALEGFTSDHPDRRARRIRELSEFLQQVRSGDPDQGVSMRHIYRHLYEKQFRFEQRQKSLVLKPKRSGRGSGLYSVARWGRLPVASDAPDFEGDFDDIFQPIEYGATVSAFEGVKTPPSHTPLSLTISELEGWMVGDGPAILLLKHTNLNDLIAFWNLRALGRLIYPVPVEWSDARRKYCQEVISHHYRAPDERGVGGCWIDVLRAPAVSPAVFQKFCQSIDPKDGAEFTTGAYPELWSNDELRRRWIRPGTAFASETSQDLRVEDDRIRIPTLMPKFLDRPSVYISGSWVNHVQIRDAYGQERGSVILPMGTWNIEELLTNNPGAGKVRQVRDGFATICRRFENHLSWKIPQGSELIPWWLRQQGWNSSPSGAGRIATQMLRALGGPSGARMICHKPVVEMLNKLVGGQARRWKSRDEILADLKQMAAKQVVAFPPDWDRLFDELVQKRLLRVGMKLTCSVCHQKNWYSLRDINDDLTCERCTSTFPFPASTPPTEAWRYRPLGSFAIEDYAHGSYTTILLLHFFLNSNSLHGAAAWSTALELKRTSEGSDHHLECDAVVFWRSIAFDSDPPSVLFAECKSNNTFKAEDLDRAKRFLTEFPGSIFVFATMKTQLGQTEKQRIRKLVKDVAPHTSANFQEYKPILVLTATELFDRFGPPSCWREAGGRFAEFAEKVGYWQELLELCDQTQRLHLSK